MSCPEFCNNVKTMDERFVPLLRVPANSRFGELSLAGTHNDGTVYLFQGNIVKKGM